MSVLLITEVNQTFLRGNQSAKPLTKLMCKRVISVMGIQTCLKVDLGHLGPFLLNEGGSSPVHSIRYHVTIVARRCHCHKVWKGNGDGRGLLS
jgi:hypothetical protein